MVDKSSAFYVQRDLFTFAGFVFRDGMKVGTCPVVMQLDEVAFCLQQIGQQRADHALACDRQRGGIQAAVVAHDRVGEGGQIQRQVGEWHIGEGLRGQRAVARLRDGKALGAQVVGLRLGQGDGIGCVHWQHTGEWCRIEWWALNLEVLAHDRNPVRTRREATGKVMSKSQGSFNALGLGGD